MRKLITVITVAGVYALALQGCNSGPFSGSGAMRIEVEVYKGPLSQEPEIQWGELEGYLREARRSLVENLNYTLSVVANRDFDSLSEKSTIAIDVNTNKSLNRFEPPATTVLAQAASNTALNPGASNTITQSNSTYAPTYLYLPVLRTTRQSSENAASDDIEIFKPSWCDSLDADGTFSQLQYFDCIVLRGLYVDSLDLIRELNSLLQNHSTQLAQARPQMHTADAQLVLRHVAAFSSDLRAKGFRWAVATTAGQSFNVLVRTAVVNFVVGASEFGNQLQARADTLMKQFDGTGRDRRELPLSSHLRETGPTDFIHLYDWLGSSTDSFRYKLPEFLYTGHWPSSADERVKIVNRLFADHFWSRINTVYASGKGQVGMAFVKDELGNWNLKNFDNAPGELLDSYVQLGTNLVKKAGQLALDINSGGSTAAISAIHDMVQEAQYVQDAAQASPNAATEARSRIKALNEKTAVTLKILTAQSETKDANLRQELSKADPSDQDKLKQVNDQIAEHRTNTLAEFEKLISSYKQQVEVIDKASSTSAVGANPDLLKTITNNK